MTAAAWPRVSPRSQDRARREDGGVPLTSSGSGSEEGETGRDLMVSAGRRGPETWLFVLMTAGCWKGRAAWAGRLRQRGSRRL